jgi:Ser/Thr protein kinase RdoA (MazF antagonist)
MVGYAPRVVIPIEPETLESVLSEFPLENPRVELEFEASAMNENLLVSDATGRRFVLRRHRRNPETERVAFQLRFQDFLRSSGYPVPEIVRTRDGQLLASRPSGAFALRVRRWESLRLRTSASGS